MREEVNGRRKRLQCVGYRVDLVDYRDIGVLFIDGG